MHLAAAFQSMPSKQSFMNDVSKLAVMHQANYEGIQAYIQVNRQLQARKTVLQAGN